MRTNLRLAIFAAGMLIGATPVLADSVAVTSGGGDSTAVVNGKPCRVVTDDRDGKHSTTVTTHGNGVSGSSSVSGGHGSSVSVGSGSSGASVSAGGGHVSVGTGDDDDCVVHRSKR